MKSLVVVLLAATAAVLSSSCAEYPLTGSVFFRDPGSGAKGGLTFEPGKVPKAIVKVPIYDSESGEQIGFADLSGPLGREVTPTK